MMKQLLVAGLLTALSIALVPHVAAQPSGDSTPPAMHCPLPDSAYCIGEYIKWIEDPNGALFFVCHVTVQRDCWNLQ